MTSPQSHSPRATRSHGELVPSVEDPEGILRTRTGARPVAASTTPRVTTQETTPDSETFATAPLETPTSTPMPERLDIAGRLEEILAEHPGTAQVDESVPRPTPSATPHVVDDVQNRDETQALRQEFNAKLAELNREIASVRAIIPSAVANEVERKTDPAKGLLRKSVEAVVQTPEVMTSLTKVMLEDDQVLKVFVGFVKRLANIAVDKRMTEELAQMAGYDDNASASVGQSSQERPRQPKTKKEKASPESDNDVAWDDDASLSSATDDTEDEDVDLTPEKERGVPVLRSVSPAFKEAVDYRFYRLKLTSSQYSDKVARRMAKWQKAVDVQMATKKFQPSDPITILPFLRDFKRECDVNRIHEGAAMWLIAKYLNEPAKAQLTSRMTRKGSHASGSLSTYCQVVNNLLRSYAPDDVVAAAECEVTRCVQGDRMTEAEFEKVLWKKALRCGSVFPEAQLKGIYIEGLRDRIRQNVRNWWSSNGHVDLGGIQRYATSVSAFAKDRPAPVHTQDKDSRGQGRRGGRAAMVVDDQPQDFSSSLSSEATNSTVMDSQALSDIMLLHGEDPQDLDSLKSSMSMDYGNNCRLCYAFRKHKTSKCPFLNNQREAFIVERNRNFARFLMYRRSLKDSPRDSRTSQNKPSAPDPTPAQPSNDARLNAGN